MLAPDATAHTVGVAELAVFGVDLTEKQQRAASAPLRSIDARPPIDLDDWELDDDLEDLGRLTTVRGTAGESKYRIDVPVRPAVTATTTTIARPTVAERESESSDVRQGMSVLAWMFLAFGLMAFMCGVVLLVWSLCGGRNELWSLGMPITVAGQVGLLLGLILQLERIWQGSRYTARKLEHVDAQLCDLKQSATMLGVNQSLPSQAFYTHLAEGAPANLLLADLKGQLDLLAVRMAERR